MSTPASCKKLTVVFPIYKDHEVLVRALKALADQTFQDFKVVILDDLSPLSYEETVAPFREHLEVMVVRNEKNLGAMGNMWKSIRFPVDTPYLLSHHADDFLKSDYLERAVSILDNDPSVTFVTTGPEWVPLGYPYKRALMDNGEYSVFDAAGFAKGVLDFVPYMFGAVVYRVAHRTVDDWEFERFDIFCDRYFLGSLLDRNETQGAFIHGRGIFERNHALDAHDDRGKILSPDHAIELMSFYKRLLLKRWPPRTVSKIITNATLYYFSNFSQREGLVSFYKKQTPRGLIQFGAIRLLGLYSLMSLAIPATARLRAQRTLRSWLPRKS